MQNIIPANQQRTRHYFTDLILLLLVFSLFYLAYLGSYALFIPDEGRYTEAAREMVATRDYITPHVNGVIFLDKPILYYWLQAISLQLFGLSEWAIRFFPALFGLLGILLTYLLGRQLFNRETGLIAAIILGTTPLYFGGAHYANLDLEVAVLISAALLSFITAMNSQGRFISLALIYFAYCFAALAFLTKGLIGIAFPIMIISTWIILSGRWDCLKKMRLVSGLSLFMLIVLPWYILVERANPTFLHYFFINQQAMRFLSAGDFNNKTPFWFYIPVLLAGFLPWTIFLLQTIYSTLIQILHAKKQDEIKLFLLIWFVIIFCFFSVPQSKTIGYIFPLFMPLALLTGDYLAKNWSLTKPTSVMTLFIVFGLIIEICILSLPYTQWLTVPKAFLPYLYTLLILLASITLAALFLSQQRGYAIIFFLCVVSAMSSLFIVKMGASHLNQYTTKPLAYQLKSILTPQDEIVNYFKFYQDLPLYLERRITLVANWQDTHILNHDNWVREMWYGRQHQSTHDWLIGENTFWSRWRSSKRLFVFLNTNYLKQFEEGTKDYYLIARHNDILLISNQPL